jgi:peptidyl-prolyl cis-trans isomerase D
VGRPEFQQNGVFSLDLYQQLLRSQGYPAAQFEEGLRHSLVTQQLRDAVAHSALIPSAQLDSWIALLKQQRELQSLILSLEKHAAQATVEDAAIADYFEKNKARFVHPEQARVQYIELKLAQIAEGISASEDELQAAYQEQIAKYGRPEQRAASHILISIAAKRRSG